jgi:hypothetical protein
VATLPVDFVTLLLPNASLHAGTERLERLASDSGVHGYRFTRSGEEHYFFFASAEKAWTLGAWASDAQFAYWSLNRERDERALVLCNGTYAEVGGMRVLASVGSVDYAEVLGSSGKTELFSSDPDRVQLQGSLDRVEAELSVPQNEGKRIGV